MHAVLLPFALAACGGGIPGKAGGERAVAHGEGSIECALEGADRFAPVCTVDRARLPEGLFLTLRRPDGGFRRLMVTTDGRGVIAADGAEPARVRPLPPDRIEVAIGGARYRLPATLRGERE